MNEWIRQWAGGICAGCMLAGVVQLLLPRSRHAPVIKNIVVLYIVLAILSPAASGAPLAELDLPRALEPQVEYDSAALESRQTEALLADSLAAELAAQGVQARVQVTLEGETGAVAVEAVAPTEAQCRLAQMLLGEWIGEGGTVECRTA